MSVILLLDANLSWRLCKMLEPEFGKVYHADRCGLGTPATDLEIWMWAKEKNAVILTNDEDYYYLLEQKGFPPKVVLLKVGNQSTQHLAKVIIAHKSQIVALHESPTHGLLKIV
jgi:predicted nuclease of predicted toxin-antitoxin system